MGVICLQVCTQNNGCRVGIREREGGREKEGKGKEKRGSDSWKEAWESCRRERRKSEGRRKGEK